MVIETNYPNPVYRIENSIETFMESLNESFLSSTREEVIETLKYLKENYPESKGGFSLATKWWEIWMKDDDDWDLDEEVE